MAARSFFQCCCGSWAVVFESRHEPDRSNRGGTHLDSRSSHNRYYHYACNCSWPWVLRYKCVGLVSCSLSFAPESCLSLSGPKFPTHHLGLLAFSWRARTDVALGRCVGHLFGNAYCFSRLGFNVNLTRLGGHHGRRLPPPGEATSVFGVVESLLKELGLDRMRRWGDVSWLQPTCPGPASGSITGLINPILPASFERSVAFLAIS